MNLFDLFIAYKVIEYLALNKNLETGAFLSPLV